MKTTGYITCVSFIYKIEKREFYKSFKGGLPFTNYEALPNIVGSSADFFKKLFSMT